MPISKPHSTLGASNTESCSALAMYLEKENRELDKLLKEKKSLEEKRAIESRKQYFFSHSKKNISTNEVIYSIDNNKKKLGKKDAKYFAPTINFSQQELKHLIKKSTENKEIDDVWQLTQKEYETFNSLILEYIRIVMTNYAKNFNREDKGLKTGDDLVYYAKIEHFRKFIGLDIEVKKGSFKSGEYKPGLNSHCHIIVSRKDETQRLKLTPTTKEKSTKRIIGGNSYHVGFDRMKWIQMNETSFDIFFNYKRPELEKFKNQYILKNGSLEEKLALNKSIDLKQKQKIKIQLSDAKNHTHKPSRRMRR